MDNNIETTYNDCVDLIRKTVWDFLAKYNKHPNEFEDWMSVANECFMDAYESHDESQSGFTTWLRTKVWYGLVMANGKELKHVRNKGRVVRPIDSPSNHQDSLSLIDLLDGLNEDARNLILLMRGVPEDLDRLFRRAKRKPARKLTFKYLMEQGWTRGKILNAFNSLKGLLTN
jgi:DNA-directed RNA polymerase specialized sigma24 family protein